MKTITAIIDDKALIIDGKRHDASFPENWTNLIHVVRIGQNLDPIEFSLGVSPLQVLSLSLDKINAKVKSLATLALEQAQHQQALDGVQLEIDEKATLAQYSISKTTALLNVPTLKSSLLLAIQGLNVTLDGADGQDITLESTKAKAVLQAILDYETVLKKVVGKARTSVKTQADFDKIVWPQFEVDLGDE